METRLKVYPLIKIYLYAVGLFAFTFGSVGFLLPAMFSTKSDECVQIAILVCVILPIVFVLAALETWKMIYEYCNKIEVKDGNK